MVVGDLAPGSENERAWEGSSLGRLLVLLGATGFAIGQPVLSMVGANTELFLLNDVDGPAVLVVGLAIALVPPLVLWLVTLGVSAMRPPAGYVLYLGVIAVLYGLAVQQFQRLAVGLQHALLAGAGSIVVGIGLALAYDRWAAVRQWARYTAILPFIAVGFYVFSSSASDLIGSQDAVERVAGRDAPPVVLVLFDEFPTLSLLDEDDQIDALRYPNIARFADGATWYRHHATASNRTDSAVPSMLSGRDPARLEPLWTNYPDNLFTLLAPTHDLAVFESATKLCGLDVCVEGPPGTESRSDADLSGLLGDTLALYGERIGWNEEVDHQADFEEELSFADPSVGGAQQASEDEDFRNAHALGFDMEASVHRSARFEAFLDSFSPEAQALYFIHLILPHKPWRFYPDGTLYWTRPMDPDFPVSSDLDSEWLAALTEQRHLLQVQYVDTLVGLLIERLRAEGIYDEAIVVLGADHGVGFRTDTPAREIGPELEQLGSIAYTPLLIKAPGQQEGSVDDSPITSQDILPTIADLAGIEVPFDVDGDPAGSAGMAERGEERAILAMDSYGLGPRGLTFDESWFPEAAERWVGPIDDAEKPLDGLYRRLDAAELIGSDVDDLLTDDGSVRATVAHLNTHRNPAPPYAEGVLYGRVSPAQTEGVIAVAVDDVVVGLSPVFTLDDRDGAFAAMLPPELATRPKGIRLALVQGDEITEVAIE